MHYFPTSCSLPFILPSVISCNIRDSCLSTCRNHMFVSNIVLVSFRSYDAVITSTILVEILFSLLFVCLSVCLFVCFEINWVTICRTAMLSTAMSLSTTIYRNASPIQAQRMCERYFSRIAQKLCVHFHEIWGMRRSQTAEELHKFWKWSRIHSGHFIVFVDSPVVNWCEKWKWRWENQLRCSA